MIEEEKTHATLTAVEAFRTARLHANLELIRASLTGKSADLLSYEAVRKKIGARETTQRELKEIPLDAIIGSVGRYRDFTRRFMPLGDAGAERWSRVRVQIGTMEGTPPIEVFQIGEVYFVRDGNHRVSVAQEMGLTHIEAYVTVVETAVPLTPDLEPDDLIIKERQAQFLENTELAETYPDSDFSMTVAGNYRVLEQQIWVHQHWLREIGWEDVTFPEAAAHWYREVYWPIIEFIRRRGIMRDFPERTETDLYVWIDKHRQELATHLGWNVDAETAVLDLADKRTPTPKRAIRRLRQKLRDAMLPPALESGPVVGEWRESWLATYREDRLFSHILVGIDGEEAGWHALQQAFRVAQREEGKLFGVHVVESAAAKESEAALAVKAEFERRCRQADLPGELTLTTGPPAGTLCYRARWADLVVVSLSHPPGPLPVDRLSSQFGQLLRRCPRPVLAVPRTHTGLERLLLAYDGSPKAEEALFVAAYLAQQWGTPLSVVVAMGKKVGEETAVRVRRYLDSHQIDAAYIIESAPPAPLILDTARAQNCDLIVTGGYGLNPVLEIVAGSTVDELLRSRNRPVLVCR